MSYCEDYIDPFDRDPDDDKGEIETEMGEWDWVCAYPDKCLMPGMHTRDECHTMEDAEAYYDELSNHQGTVLQSQPDSADGAVLTPDLLDRAKSMLHSPKR